MIPRILAILTMIGVSVGVALADGDCDWPDEKDPVKVTLVVVLASENGDHIDKKIKPLADEVKKTHPHLKSFVWKSQEIKSLKPNEKASLHCVEKKMVDMIVKHGADKDNQVSIAVKPPMMSEVEYQSVCGKFLPIVTPVKTKKGETLILAIRLEPCKK